MGIKGIKMGLCLAIMVAGLIGESMAQPPDPCITVIATMLPCLPFLIADEATPTAGCCAAFSGVLLSQPNCLCAVVNGGGPVPPLNLTLALQLPYSCNVKGSGNDSTRSLCPSSTPTVPSPAPTSGGTNNRAPSPSQSGGNTKTIMPHIIQLIASLLLAAIIASDHVL